MRKLIVFLLFLTVMSAGLSAGAQGLGVMKGFLGDPTLDGSVDVRDVQAGVSQSLGASAVMPESDINKDGQIDVRDVQQLVNSALEDGGIYQVVKGIIQAESLENLRIVAVSDDGLAAESPVDNVTGEFALSLRVKTAWTITVFEGQPKAVLQFMFGDRISQTLPIFGVSDGTAWDLGVIVVGADGVLTVPVDLEGVIDYSQGESSPGSGPVMDIYVGEVPGVPESVDRVYAHLVNQLARNTAWTIYNQQNVTPPVVEDSEIRLTPFSGRFGYGLEGPYGLTGSLTKAELTDANWILECTFSFPTGGYSVAEPAIYIAESYPEQVSVVFTVTPPSPDVAVTEAFESVSLTSVIQVSNGATFRMKVVTANSTEPYPLPEGQPFPEGERVSEGQWIFEGQPYAEGEWIPEGQPYAEGQWIPYTEGQWIPEGQPFAEGQWIPEGQPFLEGEWAFEGEWVSEGEWQSPVEPDPFFLLPALLGRDTNGDGKVTLDEAKAAMPELTYDMFKSLDANNDGALSQDDMVVTYPELPPVLDLPPYLSEEAVTELAAAIVACANAEGKLNSPVEYNLADEDHNGIPDMFQATVDCLFVALPDWSAKYSVPELADKDSNGRADVAEQSAMDAAAFTVQLLKDLGLLGCEDIDGDGLPDCIRPYMVDAGTVTPMDPNGDGVPDWACDDNGDGIPNIEDATYESVGDLDRDGVPDAYDADMDGDGVPNYCDADPKNPLNSEVVVPPSGDSSGGTTDDVTNLVLTEADNGTSGSVTQNGKFVLSLPSYADGGYEWAVTDIDSKILQNLAHTHDLSRCPNDVEGCSGREVFTFKALEVGMSQLSLESRRVWEPATTDPAATFTVTIHVLPDGVVTVVSGDSVSGTGW